MPAKKTTPLIEALNNPLLFAIALVGLSVYVYQNDIDRQQALQDANAVVIQTLQKKTENQNDVLLRMQEAQAAIAKQIERNTDKINAIGSDRFTDRDGSNLREGIREKFDEERAQRRQADVELREWLRSIDAEIDSVKQELRFMPHNYPNSPSLQKRQGSNNGY